MVSAVFYQSSSCSMCWCRLIFKSPRISVASCIASPERIWVLVYWGSHNTVKHGPQDDTVLLSRGFCFLSDGQHHDVSSYAFVQWFCLRRSRTGRSLQRCSLHPLILPSVLSPLTSVLRPLPTVLCHLISFPVSHLLICVNLRNLRILISVLCPQSCLLSRSFDNLY